MKKSDQANILPDGSIIDLDSYDWPEGVDLRKKEKLFIIWYTLPQANTFKDPTAAAYKAGYKANSAYKAKINLVNHPKIKPIIEKFSEQFTKIAIKDAAQKLMQEKIRRATYKIDEFYEEKEIFSDGGIPKTIIAMKDITDLTEEQKTLVENIEFTNTGIPSYKLPNKEREINEIIKLNAEINEEKSIGDYDVETTVDVVKDNLATVKTTIHLNNQKIKENAQNYIENSENQPDYD